MHNKNRKALMAIAKTNKKINKSVVKAKSVVVTKPSESKFTTVHAATIKPSMEPEEQDDGSTLFRMVYVASRPRGKQVTAECTQDVANFIVSQQLTKKYQSDFRLRVNDAGVVVSIDVVPKKEFQDVEATLDDDGNTVVFQKNADSTFTLLKKSDALADAVIDHAAELLHENPNVDDQEWLATGMQVTGISKSGGVTSVTVTYTGGAM